MNYFGEALLGRRSGSLLDWFGDYGAGVRERVGLLASDPVEFARQGLLDVVPNKAEADAAKARIMGGQYDPKAYRNYIGKMQDLGSLLASIKVYHGSPHKFDKFDSSKIGTGEGAQAYGHGLYFADNPAVAQDYAWNLSKNKADRLKFDGRVISADNIYGRSLEDVALIGKDAALQKLDDNIRFNEKYAPDIAAMYRSTRERIAVVDPAQVSLNRGQIYEADLRWPDAAREAADPLGPQHFLDWDKPLSEQPAAVRDSVKRAFDEIFAGNGAANYEGAVRQRMTAGEVVQQLSGRGPASGKMAAQTSARFADAGIPGIRYLDAGSRGASQGTSNYVVFDDALIELLTRNGKPVK